MGVNQLRLAGLATMLALRNTFERAFE